jgi:hypothetical protein
MGQEIPPFLIEVPEAGQPELFVDQLCSFFRAGSLTRG